MVSKSLKINDPVHGFLIFPDIISKIVDTIEIQRLNRVRQLAGAHYVFPGASHTRFEHSLGVASLAQRLMTYFVELHHMNITKEDINDCIIAALCHDVGHGPFSHNFEAILLKYLHKDHEDFTHWIISKSEIGDVLESLGFDKNYIANLAVGRSTTKNADKAFLINQIISSAVNVDSIDYLLRDNYHCGTRGNSIDTYRLLMAIEEMDGGILGINIRALIALEGFLLARLSSFRTIYFHKTCRAVQLMTIRAIEQIKDEIGLLDYKTPDDYILWDDYTLWTELSKNINSKSYIDKLKRRQLLKACYESKFSLEKMNYNTSQIQDELASLTNIPRSEIFIDTPRSSSVPYSHMAETRSNEIFTFSSDDQEKKRIRLEDSSIFFDQFRGEISLLRIYTWPEYRKTLTEAIKKINLQSDNNIR